MKKPIFFILVATLILSSMSVTFCSEKTYTISSGDVLWKIAKDHHIPLKTLISINPQIKNPHLIFPGTTLNLSPKSKDSEMAFVKFPYINHPQDAVKTFDDGITIAKRRLSVSSNLYVPASQTDKNAFPKGFYTGFGSAMTLKSIGKDSLSFYVLTDRGPNGDGPTYENQSKEQTPAKLFPQPKFVPQIGIANVDKNKAVVESALQIQSEDGKPISGLPLPANILGSTKETPLTPSGTLLNTDIHGLDPEGIAVDKNGHFWICDEYGPFVLKLDNKGKILKRYSAGKGLPEMVKYRHPNRGMEGLTIAPNGKVYAAVQSTLNVNDKSTRNTAQFTRIVEIDPSTDAVRTLAYPIDIDAYGGKNKNCKIGDLYALTNNKMIIIEQGNTKNGKMNKLFLIDISKATDITGKTLDGKALEFTGTLDFIKDVHFIDKKFLIDLRNYGWTPSKAEGLVALPDKQTLVIINDNDFAMKTQAVNSKNETVDIEDYTLLFDGTYLNKKGEKESLSIKTMPTDESLSLWFVHFPKPIVD